MENLTSRVANIQGDLHRHRRQLQTLETNVKASVGGEVQCMKAALVGSDDKIQYVSSGLQSCLSQIEYHSDTGQPDLAPQMTWLSTRLGEIVHDFETAQSHDETAIGYVNDFTYKILDVGQEVEASRGQLTEAEADSEILARTAQEELESSESLLSAAQAKIAEKGWEISAKSREASAKRQRKTQLDREIADKNRRIREVEAKVSKKKDRAAISGGLGILGIALAPVTFGTSLALTVGAGVAVGVNLDDISDLKKELRASNSSISQLQSEIAQADRDVSLLEAEQRELQRLVTRYQSEVSTRNQNHQQHRNQIEKTSQIKGEISVLDQHASSTTETITESQRELQKIKQNLDACSALLKERSLEVQTSSGFLERFLGKTYHRRQEFRRQKSLLAKVSGTLDKIHKEMPALLPSSDTKLLDSSPWNAKAQPLVNVREPIPELSFLGND